MQKTVTTSLATKNFFPSSAEDLLSPISLTNRTRKADSRNWSQTHDISNAAGVATQENWNSSVKETAPTQRRVPSVPLQKHPLFPNMTRTSQQDIGKEHSALSPDRNAPGNRWRFNANGQFVDSDAGWDLADEIVRLNIGDGEDLHGQMRTPPKSKMGVAAVVQLNEGSPLETSSDASVDSSPHPSDHQISLSHSRGSSTDTTISSSQESLSGASQILLAPAPIKATTGEVKERPHSFSGGLSTADLRRLQQVGEGGPGNISAVDGQLQWTSLQYRDGAGHNDKQFPPDQLIYPSLANHAGTPPRAQQQQQQQPYDYRLAPAQANAQREDTDYMAQQRGFNGVSHGSVQPVVSPPFPGRASNGVNGMSYRQVPRGFAQQGLVPTPPTLGYPGHSSHLSLGNTQQLYDMMLPGPPHEHPAVARVQQQHNVFRATHHHSASDPSTMRDAATLAMLNGNMQAFGVPGPGMFPQAMAPLGSPPMTLYASQYYGAQEAYPRSDLATAQLMAAARLQTQYTGSYDGGLTSPVSVGSQNGPSANNRKLGLYKTELCRSWEEKGTCRYGAKCQFAHGEDELRKVSRHPKYKTEICRTFWVSGSCPYGKRCCFIHTELPASGAPGTAGTPNGENAPPPPRTDGRARSLSINSDPNDAAVSLLARISAQRGQDSNNSSTPVDMSPQSNGYHFNSRPPTGSLRVDTSALDNPVVKQNKSAYPSFASNGVLMPASEQPSIKSPVPVTAGPDLGRHNNSRLEIVGYNQRINKPTSTNPNIRHSFNGTEVDLNFNTSPPSVSNHSSYALSSVENNSSASQGQRANGHSRSGSAGNWGSFSRSAHLAPSPYPHSSSPAGEMKMNSPWSTSELAVGSSRLNEKAWA
jgi:hypothetical protein